MRVRSRQFLPKVWTLQTVKTTEPKQNIALIHALREKFQWYDKVIPQSRRNNLSHLVKRKHLCSDWSFTDMYFVDYESLNMHIWSMLAHISFEIWTHLDISLLIITWQCYHTSGQLYSSLFRYWSITYDLKRKIGMDANNFKSPFVHAMTWGCRQQAITWVTFDECDCRLYKAMS